MFAVAYYLARPIRNDDSRRSMGIAQDGTIRELVGVWRQPLIARSCSMTAARNPGLVSLSPFDAAKTNSSIA